MKHASAYNAKFILNHALKPYLENSIIQNRHRMLRSFSLFELVRANQSTRGTSEKGFGAWSSFSATNIFKSSPTSDCTPKRPAHFIPLSRFTKDVVWRVCFNPPRPVRFRSWMRLLQLCEADQLQ